MKKLLSLFILGILMLSTIGIASADIPYTHVKGEDMISSTIDGQEVLSPLRPRLGMTYRERYYPRRDTTFSGGRLGVTLSGATSETGGGRLGTKPIYSTLRVVFSKATLVEQLDECNIRAEYKANYATVKHGRSWGLLREPTATAIHNDCDDLVSLTIEHPDLDPTNAVFSASVLRRARR